MKKIIALLFILFLMPTAFAEENATNIKIKISGNLKKNQYFLCLHDTGCFSIFAAQQGKIYSIANSMKLDNKIYVLNSANFRISNQELPDSCKSTSFENKTLTISGEMINEAENVRIKNLTCSVA